jgi:hypothetical protein
MGGLAGAVDMVSLSDWFERSWDPSASPSFLFDGHDAILLRFGDRLVPDGELVKAPEKILKS